MKRTMAMSLMLTGALLLAACHGKSAVKEQPTAATAVPANPAATTGGTGSGGTSMTPLGADTPAQLASLAQSGNDAPLDERTIYFDFDKSEIKSQYDGIVTNYAKTLSAHPGLKVRLEGNTDDRGSREYNIGLGERRAQAVRQALMLQGVADSQITTVSYGAERPAVEGNDETAWAKNRRVDLVYQP